MAQYHDTNGYIKWCFTHIIIGFPDDCTLELFDTEEEATAKILDLGLDYSRTDWTP
jgi:hypothetical protein